MSKAHDIVISAASFNFTVLMGQQYRFRRIFLQELKTVRVPLVTLFEPQKSGVGKKYWTYGSRAVVSRHYLSLPVKFPNAKARAENISQFASTGSDLPYGFLGFNPWPREFKGPLAKSSVKIHDMQKLGAPLSSISPRPPQLTVQP
ncbi:hypothetical protein EVAR_68046_1 [Eumeta japonica]|uniref:Uncharacterized protein n=1 Tax=Eumeta variegata TaxID=151549 RepID=A0A4C1ZUP2_EUMVA|nr:hypothetical protein EVAR_68046_1 [Eumeta japonica]